MPVIFSKSSGLNDSIFGKSYAPIKAIVEQGVEAFENKAQVNEIFKVDPTSDFAAKYTSETSLGNFEQTGEGGAYPRTSMQEGYSKIIEPGTFKSSFEVTQEMIEDAKMGKIKSKAGQFTLSYGRTKEMLGAAMLMGASGTSATFGNGNQPLTTYDTTAADGVALFSTAHPSKTGNGSNQSNFFSTNAAFSYDALCYAEEKMQKFKDDDGNLLSLMPDTIVIPAKARLKKVVFDAIGSDGVPGTANNSFNYQVDRWNVIMWPYLDQYIPSGITAGADPWFLMDSQFNEQFFGAVWSDRVPLTVKSTVTDENDNNVWRGRARFMPGFNNWRFILGCFPGLAGGDLSA